MKCHLPLKGQLCMIIEAGTGKYYENIYDGHALEFVLTQGSR
jgi:hypothetical protein